MKRKHRALEQWVQEAIQILKKARRPGRARRAGTYAAAGEDPAASGMQGAARPEAQKDTAGPEESADPEELTGSNGETEQEDDNMTAVPIYDVMILPHVSIYFQTQTFRSLAGTEVSQGEEIMFMILREEKSREEIREDSFYPIAVSGLVKEINKDGYVVIQTEDRVSVESVEILENREIVVTGQKLYDVADLDEAEAAVTLKKIKEELKDLTSRFRWGSIMQNYIDQYSSLQEVAAIMSPWLTIGSEERYAVLREDRLSVRNKMLEKILYEYIEVTKVTTDAQTAQQEDYQKVYREQALKRQVEYLQKELDDMHPENVSDIRRFEIRIEECGMNEQAKKEATKVLNRLRQDGQNSAESGMLYDYLDFLTGLSWKKEEAKEIDLDEAERILGEDHFGLKRVKDRIIQQIAVMNLRKQQSGSILLFVGAPGTGKTSIGKSIARALGREYVRVSLGGIRDEADIRGHRRTYIGAMPGRIIDGIEKSGVSNPVMVLDEVDKLSSSYNGDPASALLEVLDPEQNNTFTDHYMNVPYDLSDVLFICTANTLDTIPQPLLNRMEVIQFQGYTPTEKFEIARQHLLPKSRKAVGIAEDRLEVTDEALEMIISDYTREGGVRGLKKRLDTLARVAAVKSVRGSGDKIVVNREDLREFLDDHPIRHNRVRDTANPGIVTGLAWTPVGGEILYIETILTAGSGKITITGQLGDVMKESAQIAVSLVKSMLPETTEKFQKNDLHIHVPDGSTPKDGPSAGITMTTAIASLVTGRAVTPHIAMTGEVSLMGRVNPIGGLPEKLMAAQRAGVQKVFIPKDNVEDLRDVAEEVKEKLEIIPVETVEEVLKQTGVLA